MARLDMEVLLELRPGSPQQQHVLGLIEKYLTDKVDDPKAVALHVWRLTRITMRPIRPPIPPIE